MPFEIPSPTPRGVRPGQLPLEDSPSGAAAEGGSSGSGGGGAVPGVQTGSGSSSPGSGDRPKFNLRGASRQTVENTPDITETLKGLIDKSVRKIEAVKLSNIRVGVTSWGQR